MSDLKDLTSEELKELIKGSSPVLEVEDKSNVPRFLKEFGIISGSVKIPNYYFFYLYKKEWSPEGPKLTRIGFFRALSKHLSKHRSKHTRYYLIGRGSLNPTQEELERAKRYNRYYESQTIQRSKRK